jgi:hypothetical protein
VAGRRVVGTRATVAHRRLESDRSDRFGIAGRDDGLQRGRSFIANPDLVERLRNRLPIAEADPPI